MMHPTDDQAHGKTRIATREQRPKGGKYTNPLKSRNLSTFSELLHPTDLYPVCPVLLGSSKTQRAFEDERLK